MNELVLQALIGTLTTALISPLAFHLLKKKEERSQKVFDLRYSEYKHYLGALDRISEVARTGWTDYYRERFPDVFRAILNPDLSEEDKSNALIMLNTELVELTAKFMDTVGQSEHELNGLKLVCSDQLFTLIQEFIPLQKQLISAGGDWIGGLKNLDPENPQVRLTEELTALSKKAEEMYNAIFRQMRQELKLDKR